MKNSETKHIMASIAFCTIGIMLLAVADLGSVIMPLEVLPGETAGEVLIGLIGLILFFIGGFYAFVRLRVIHYCSLANKYLN